MTSRVLIISSKALLTILVLVTFLSSAALAKGLTDLDDKKRQVETYSALLSEEEIASERNRTFLKNASDSTSRLFKKYQSVLASGTSSSTSPISRKHFDSSLSTVMDENSALSSLLQDVLQEAEQRLDFLQSYSELLTIISPVPQGLGSIVRETQTRVHKLTADTQRLIAQNKELQRQSKRLLSRIERAHHKDKLSLYDLWIQYLLIGKIPVFTMDFWDNPIPDKRWVILKKNELQAGLSVLGNNLPKLIILFLTLVGTAYAARKLLKYFPEKQYDEDTNRKTTRYVRLTTAGFALYLTTRIIYSEGMDALAALAASLILFGVIKLAKHICKDSFLATYGHTRISILFLLSSQLLIFHLPSRTTTLFFIVLVLTLWGLDTLQAWRHKGQPLTKTAMRGGSLAPLFLVSFFGYGRLACLLTIIWCLAIFIRAFGNVWSHSLFIETDKSSKLQKGLAKSLLVPLGWAISFGLTYLWLVDFLGENTLFSILQLKATFGDYSLYLNDIVILVVLFFLTYNCIAAFKVSIDHVGSRWQRAKRGAVPSIQTLFTYATWSLFTLLALRILGVSLTSITVIAGGLSVGIGFGLQNVVNNFISGLILLFGRSIQQGDVIEVGNMWCTVKKINIRTTLVETFESAVIMIPNSDLVTTQVTNWTKNNPTLRRDILVGVAYGSDTRKVESTLLKVAASHPHVLKKPEPFILFSDFGANSLDFILRVWIDDIDNTIRATSELRFAIDDAFREANIEIAFPQLDVHFKTAAALEGRAKLLEND
ncbi:mechanosensitive ion channel domain-containing protein [Pseudodesulfovibrio sp. zrk46]|uniref:mechanosensitive ion channel family protein n=1 Tax=Pseudodesulfovibrio sp. zrk46 TaxID=2725288 RepID=UPI001449FB4A|nr:mechanosensitive ion channel domain-containing protein [Pseudodesulfovibrio sp. zrk46]QJB57203.1 mechanosensitive ion channel [Pseudodesulfovibrio sp. zrk46]